LCQVPIVRECSRCGFDHAVSMCPAQGKICTRCNKPNHLREKCLSKLNDEE
jgi:Ni,Fe-hydrogenase I small subunit